MALGLAKALVGYRNWWELRASFPHLISTCSTPCHDDDKHACHTSFGSLPGARCKRGKARGTYPVSVIN